MENTCSNPCDSFWATANQPTLWHLYGAELTLAGTESMAMSVLLLVIGVLVGVGYIFHNVVVKGKRCTSKTKLHGKTVIVTGSNTGIGKETAIHLAKRGARVILACRSQHRAEAALAEVKRLGKSNEVVFMQLDLGSLKSFRSFAETFLKTEPRLDLLINNAGIYMQGRTEDGLGMMFGVNHIGPFLLTNLLLERLKECGPSRVVNVASVAHNTGAIDFDFLNTHKALGLVDSFVSNMKTYSDSKLCNVLFTHELAKTLQGTQVTCYCLHPGSNTGIGKTTAIELAKRGARVILACRSKQRAEAALADIKKESGSNEVVFMHLDLGSLKSVRSFAEIFLKTEPRLDLLINNAGIVMQTETEDGLGMMLGVNHIGHFLLTNLLLERLKECGPSRVVNVASTAHNLGKIDFDLLKRHKRLGMGDSFIQILKTYSNSKLCNVLFTHELARKLQDTTVTCYSLHPGVVSTEIARDSSKLQKLFWKPISVLFLKNPVQGAQTTLHCALQEGIEHLSGRYFSNCTVRKVFAKARDDAVAKKLWEVSERLSGPSSFVFRP